MAKKLEPQKPDEVFSMGPLAMARFGKNIIYESNWPEGEFDKFQKRLIEDYPKVVGDINVLVTEIADLIKVLPPEKLLHHAWWEMAMAHTKIKAEVEIGEKEGTSLRMVDYVQSVIAAVSPAENQRDDVTDEEWANLRSKIEELFTKINLDYQICRSAKNRTDDPNFDKNFEEFQFKAQLFWCNLRGHRYQVHQPAYLDSLMMVSSKNFSESPASNSSWKLRKSGMFCRSASKTSPMTSNNSSATPRTLSTKKSWICLRSQTQILLI